MSQDLERVYTINLGKVLISTDTHRATRAINMIKEFARHHMKIEDVKIEEDLAHQIWARGARHPPRKIRVRMTQTDEGFVLVSPYEEEVEETKPEKEKGKISKEPAKEKSAKLEEQQTKELVEESAKQEELEVPKKEEQVKEETVKEEPSKKEKVAQQAELVKEEPAKKEAPKESKKEEK